MTHPPHHLTPYERIETSATSPGVTGLSTEVRDNDRNGRW